MNGLNNGPLGRTAWNANHLFLVYRRAMLQAIARRKVDKAYEHARAMMHELQRRSRTKEYALSDLQPAAALARAPEDP